MFKNTIIYTNLDDLPIDNFKKVLETGDIRNAVSFTNILGQPIKGTVKKRHYKKVNEAWTSCYDEYLRVFGLNKRHVAIMVQEEKIAKLKVKRWITGRSSVDGLIYAAEKKLEGMKPKETASKRTFAEDLAIVQKYNGYPMPAKETSSTMFFTYVKMMEKEANEIKKQNNAKSN